MDAVRRTLEVERIVNLIRGFGWDKKTEETDGETIRLTMEKTIVPESATEG